jgi:hypothetical protein
MDAFLVKEEYGLEVTMLSYGVSILFSFFQNKKKAKERMSMTMSQVRAAAQRTRAPSPVGGQRICCPDFVSRPKPRPAEFFSPWPAIKPP